jgi:hypothetical protein
LVSVSFISSLRLRSERLGDAQSLLQQAEFLNTISSQYLLTRYSHGVDPDVSGETLEVTFSLGLSRFSDTPAKP